MQASYDTIAVMKRVIDLERKAGGFVSEFWKFAAKGNVFDLAVAVILGNAFSAVVNSLVADVAMPLLSFVTGSVQDLSGFKYALTDNVVIGYGHLLQVFINFLIIALSIFLMFKLVSSVRKRLQKREDEGEKSAPLSTEEKLLTEIRDLLKAQSHDQIAQ